MRTSGIYPHEILIYFTVQKIFFLLRLHKTLFLYISKTIFGEILKNALRSSATTPVIYTQTVKRVSLKKLIEHKKREETEPWPVISQESAG